MSKSYPNERTIRILDYYNTELNPKVSPFEMMNDLQYLLHVISPLVDEDIRDEAKKKGW